MYDPIELGREVALADMLFDRRSPNPYLRGTQEREQWARAYYRESMDCFEASKAIEMGAGR
jgi:hypothetical protein